MRQVNINVTSEFERDLLQYMKNKGIATKSDAIRRAVHEAVKQGGTASFDYRSWLGFGLKSPLRRNRRFKSEDDLWL